MEAYIRYWYQEGDDDTKRLNSITTDLPCVTEEDKMELASNYLCNILMEPGEDGNITVLDFGVTEVILGSLETVEQPMAELPELDKISFDLNVLSERMYLDLHPDTRFWGRTKNGDWRLSVKRADQSALVFKTNEIYFPNPDKMVLIETTKTISLIQKQSPEKASKMATKKATKKTAKKAATKKSSGTKKEGGPTKKELVRGFLKAGKKPAEIVEAMAKNGTPSTIASVRAFIATINAGG